MFAIDWKVEPVCYDEYDRPHFPINQAKGLYDFQDVQLMKDAMAAGYTAAIEVPLFRMLQREVRNASAGRQVDILDIGGCDGFFFDRVQRFVHTYINLEPNLIAPIGKIAERERHPRYQIIRCSAEDIPLHNESADVVISFASIDHIPDTGKALSEITRVLRKGGTFILLMNNRRSWWKTLLSHTSYMQERERQIAGVHYVQWSLADCKKVLSEFMPVVKIYSTTFLPYVPKIWPYVLPVFDMIGKRLMPARGANIIAVARKPL